MADITMCDDDSCPSKMKCYTYTAPVNQWRQSYFVISPMNSDGTCGSYRPNSLQGEDE